MSEHWQYFNWLNIRSEAEHRLGFLKRTQESGCLPAATKPEEVSIEYQCAQAAHLNAVSCLEGQIARLTAEVERLTAALRGVVTGAWEHEYDNRYTLDADAMDAARAALTPEGQAKLVPPTAEQKAYLDHIQRATNYDPNAVIGGPPKGQSGGNDTGKR